MEEKKKKNRMVNITINIPDLYDENMQKLIRIKKTPSRSEFIRQALREFLIKQYQELIKLGFFDEKSNQKTKVIIPRDLKQKTKKIDWNTPEIKNLIIKLDEKYD